MTDRRTNEDESMKKLKIITGKKNRQNPYWVDHYIAPAFKHLGHSVTETGELNRGGFDLGFVVRNMSFKRRQWRDYPVGFWGVDSTGYRSQYRKIAKHFDVFFVDRYDQVKHYKKFSKKAVYLPYASWPAVHKAVPTEEIYDIGFVGRYSKNRGIFLGSLRHVGLKIKIHWSGSKYKSPMRSKMLSWADTRKLYSQCKIIFNCHKDATNKRVFEGMSIGKLMLTRQKRGDSEPTNLFRDGEHLVTYKGKKDLISKAKYYASHPDEREAIAKAGQELVHEKHKWTDRMQYVINTLKGWD